MKLTKVPTVRKGFLIGLLAVVIFASWLNAVVETTDPVTLKFTEQILVSNSVATIMIDKSTGTLRSLRRLGRVGTIIIFNRDPANSVFYGSHTAIIAGDDIRVGGAGELPKRSAYHTKDGDNVYGISAVSGTGVGGSTVAITYEIIGR